MIAWILLASAAWAAPSFPPVIERPKKTLSAVREADFALILDEVASALVGKPYLLGPLGEGEGAEHPEPLYRLDAFDCTTFLETVMANAYCYRAGAKAGGCIERRMREIRYAKERVAFRERNHVPEADWLPNNARKGFLADLQNLILPGEWKSAVSPMNRERWLESRTKEKAKAGVPAADPAKLAYLPVAAFFRKNELSAEASKALEEKLAAAEKEIAAKREEQTDAEEAKEERAKDKFRAELAYLREAYSALPEKLALIPSGTVLSLLRAPVKDPARAAVMPIVAHQGLVVQRADGAHILHAAPNLHKVKDQKLGDYLLRYVRSGNYRGISLYKILLRAP